MLYLCSKDEQAKGKVNPIKGNDNQFIREKFQSSFFLRLALFCYFFVTRLLLKNLVDTNNLPNFANGNKIITSWQK